MSFDNSADDADRALPPDGWSNPLPRRGRLAGIDFGTVRMGLAICDLGQQFSSPLEVYHRRNLRLDAHYLRQLAEAESLQGFVVGLPLHTSGQESEKSQQARAFAQWLEGECQRPVVMFDERFTTAQARELLNESKMSGRKRKERLDKIAAHILLAAYLESPDQAVAWAIEMPKPLDDVNDSSA